MPISVRQAMSVIKFWLQLSDRLHVLIRQSAKSRLHNANGVACAKKCEHVRNFRSRLHVVIMNAYRTYRRRWCSISMQLIRILVRKKRQQISLKTLSFNLVDHHYAFFPIKTDKNTQKKNYALSQLLSELWIWINLILLLERMFHLLWNDLMAIAFHSYRNRLDSFRYVTFRFV